MMRRVLPLLMLAIAGLTANPALARREWTSPATVPGSDGAGFPYKVVLMRDGTAAVVFVRDGVRVALRSPLGGWSATRRVSTGHTAVATPEIATDGRGELLVAWTQSRTTGAVPTGLNSVKLAIRATNGRWSAPRTVGATEHFVQGEPRLAMDGRGDAVLGWVGVRSRAITRDVLRVAYRPALGRFGEAHSFNQAGMDLRLVMDARGVAYAAWSHLAPPAYVHSSVMFATRSRRGVWSHGQVIAGRDAGGPQLVLLPDRRVLIAWRSREQGIGSLRTGLVTVTARDPGGHLAPRQVLSPVRSPGPQVVPQLSGGVLVAWNDTAATDAEPALPSLFWTVGAMGPEGLLFAPVESRFGIGLSALGAFGDGTALAVWGSTTIHAAARVAGSSFGSDEIVSRGGGFPVLATRGARAAAVWLQDGRLVIARRRG